MKDISVFDVFLFIRNDYTVIFKGNTLRKQRLETKSAREFIEPERGKRRYDLLPDELLQEKVL